MTQPRKRTGFVLTFQLLFFTIALSQTPKIVREGLEEKEVVEVGNIFKYAQFVQGDILFKDGTHSKAQLNYNLLVGEMLFTANNGDTLALADESTIKYITILSDTFYFDKQFLVVINGQAKYKLASHQRLIAVDNQTIGAYGQRVPSSSVTSYNYVNVGNRITKLGVTQFADLKLVDRYFFGDRYDHFLPLSKKNVLKRFSKHQNKIEEFFQNNSLNLNNEEHAIKLISFLEGLN